MSFSVETSLHYDKIVRYGAVFIVRIMHNIASAFDVYILHTCEMLLLSLKTHDAL